MPRSGIVVPLFKTNINKNKLNSLKGKHGAITELREYSNGRIGAFFEDKQFRFVGLTSKKDRNIFKRTKSPKKCTKCRGTTCQCMKSKKSQRKRTKSPKKCTKSPKKHKRSSKKKIQAGGGAIELKHAVALLREHYFKL